MDINLAETMDEMTMLCWVKIQSVGNLYNTLLESQRRKSGAPGWYIFRNGTMLLNLHRYNGIVRLRGEASYTSPKVWNQGMRGVWMHLGVRITQGRIAFFKNGKRISDVENTVDFEFLKIGLAEIGNSYKQAKRRYIPLNFHGQIDEFLIFKKGLSDMAIQEIFTQGNVE